MAYSDQADDWQAVGICQVGAAVGAGGGLWLFQLQSFNAGQYGAYFLYAGLGLGLGGSIGGFSLPDFLANGPPGTSPLAWSALSCDTQFSASDLNLSGGRLTTAGLSAIVGYSLQYITAAGLTTGSLFASQACNGWVGGVGANAITTVGVWKYVQDAPYQVIW